MFDVYDEFEKEQGNQKKKTFLGFFEIILLNTEKFKYYVTELLWLSHYPLKFLKMDLQKIQDIQTHHNKSF